MAKRNKPTKDIDKGANKIIRDMKTIHSASIEAGYFSGVQSGDPKITLAEVAAINEFGSDDNARPPARPFLRPAFDKNIDKYRKISKELLVQLAGKSLNGVQVLSTIGALMASDIKLEITNVREPKNADSTKAAKGFDNPLIETGTMKNRADFRIKL